MSGRLTIAKKAMQRKCIYCHYPQTRLYSKAVTSALNDEKQRLKVSHRVESTTYHLAIRCYNFEWAINHRNVAGNQALTSANDFASNGLKRNDDDGGLLIMSFVL